MSYWIEVDAWSTPTDWVVQRNIDGGVETIRRSPSQVVVEYHPWEGDKEVIVTPRDEVMDDWLEDMDRLAADLYC